MVRDIRKLDMEAKEEYGFILGNLLLQLKDVDTFQMEEFYKVLAYIELPKKHRKKLVELLLSNKKQGVFWGSHLESLLNKVKGQERDILRLTLMEDLLSVATANHYMYEDKKTLLEDLKEQLLISDEQMRIFFQEPNQKYGLSIKDKSPDMTSQGKKIVSKCLALGIPLSLLYFSQHNAYRHNYKSFTLLKLQRTLNPRNGVLRLAKYLVLGGVLYKGALWGMNRKYRNQEKVEKMLKKESKELYHRGKKYLEEDLYHVSKILGNKTANKHQENFIMMMEKTLLMMDGNH